MEDDLVDWLVYLMVDRLDILSDGRKVAPMDVKMAVETASMKV